MFAGHAAIALAVRHRLPRHSLGWLFAATYLIDLIWPILLLLGVERVAIDPGNTAFTPLYFVSYPWTHSLLMAIGWGLAFAWLRLRHPGPWREYTWLTALVVSHWLLDMLTHRPDLPLTPGTSPKLGLGLWNSIPGTLIVEGALFAGGILLYVRHTKSRDRTGTLALWSLLALILVIWVSGPFSPPPPSAQAIGVVGLLSWLLPLWAGWADRHRSLTTGAPSAPGPSGAASGSARLVAGGRLNG